MTTEINWTNDDVFAARDQRIAYRDGRTFKVKLYTSGWALIGDVMGQGPEGMSIWEIRSILNNTEAAIAA